jgi:hypothetical protein
VKSGFRAWWPNLLLTAMTLMVVIAGFEVLLHFALPQKLYRFPKGMFVNDPDLVFRMSPGFKGVLKNPEYTTHFRINSLGLRGPEPRTEQAGSTRILGLGDSFVSALNVEESETFLAVAESTLRKDLGTARIDITNSGTPNYGTWHELRLFRKLAPLLNPQAVLLCVYVGNDVENNLSPRVAVVRDGLLMEGRPQSGILPYGLRSWLQRNSMAYVFFWNAWNQLRPRIGLTGSDTLRPERELISARPSPYVVKGYEVTRELLRQFRDESEFRGIPLFLVLIPAEFQVYPERFENALRKQGVDCSSLDFDLPQKRWSEILSSLRLPFIDLLQEFRSRRNGSYLYMSLDGHLTVEGNRLAGEAIGQALAPFLQQKVAGLR